MKTASEFKAEITARLEAAWQAKAQKIDTYLASLPSLDGVDDSVRVKGLRHGVKEGRLTFSDIACDKCNTELVHGGMVNLSNPPTRWHDCPGCGNRHLLPV